MSTNNELAYNDLKRWHVLVNRYLGRAKRHRASLPLSAAGARSMMRWVVPSVPDRISSSFRGGYLADTYCISLPNLSHKRFSGSSINTNTVLLDSVVLPGAAAPPKPWGIPS